MISRLSQIYNFSSLDSRRVWMFAKSDLANPLFTDPFDLSRRCTQDDRTRCWSKGCFWISRIKLAWQVKLTMYLIKKLSITLRQGFASFESQLTTVSWLATSLTICRRCRPQLTTCSLHLATLTNLERRQLCHRHGLWARSRCCQFSGESGTARYNPFRYLTIQDIWTFRYGHPGDRRHEPST